MSRHFVLLAFCIFCGNAAEVKRHVAETSQAISYGLGGSHVTFPDVNVGENEVAKCHIKSESGEESISSEPLIPFNQQNVICLIPQEIKSGRVEVDLEVQRKVQEVYSRTIFVDPAPKLEIQVTEQWNTNQLVLTWDPEYFKQFFDPGATILLRASVYVAIDGTPNYQPTEVTIVAGLNNAGTATVPVSEKTIEIISNFRFPYFYILFPPGNPEYFQVSGLLTPTLGIDEGIAKDVCSNWTQNALNPGIPITPCPPCLCKAKLDMNFEPTVYPPQILQLAEGRLDNHILYYEKVAEGQAQTCSYNTANDNLATASPAQAGWLHRVTKHVSYEENYFSDIWPYIVCCLQTNSLEHCSAFHEKRPVDTGHTYPGPDDPCSGTEDPHMTTFDGVRYDFMGWGEFWLIRGPSSSGFGVQGRMSPNFEGQQVSYYKAVAIRDRNTTLQFDIKDQVIRVLLNGEEIAIPGQGLTLPHKEMYLTISGNQAEVRARTGFTIRIISNGVYFNLYGYGAVLNRDKGFMGIFGNFDGNATNDLTSQTGLLIENTDENLRNLSLIHNVFGLSWMTTEQESYFTYEENMSWANYTNVDFGPIFEYPNPEDMPESVRAICGSSLACYYEYIGTGEDLGAAEGVVGQEKEYDELKEEIEKKIYLCATIPAEEIPQNGRVDVEGYLNGSQAIYSCGEEYDIVTGSNKRTCIAEEGKAEWFGDVPECTWTCNKCLESVEYQMSPDPNDCTKYYLCASGQRFSLDCSTGQHFSKTELVCLPDIECETGCS